MFQIIDPESATGAAAELLSETSRQLGRAPNLYRAMANSPAALRGYLAFRGALLHGTLSAEVTERIALLVAQLNRCDYCVAAHSLRGRKLGLTPEELHSVRSRRSGDPKVNAAMAFLASLIEGKGSAAPELVGAVFAAGWTEAEVGEFIAHVALNVFSNYFKNVANPPLDFPQAAPLETERVPGQQTMTTIDYAVDTTSAEGQWVALSSHDFARTIELLKEAIARLDLWLINEIDPQVLMQRANMQVHPARQLLFFHPRYMKRLLAADARAVQEVPMKIVALAHEDGTVVLRGPDLSRLADRYPQTGPLGKELAALCQAIVAAVGAPLSERCSHKG